MGRCVRSRVMRGLEMRHTGSGCQELIPVSSALAKEGTRWVQRSLKGLRSGEGVRFATLFWSDEIAHPRTYALNPEASGYRIVGEGTEATVSLSPERGSVEIEADAALLPTAGSALDGLDAGPFLAERGEAKPAWRGYVCRSRYGDGCVGRRLLRGRR